MANRPATPTTCVVAAFICLGTVFCTTGAAPPPPIEGMILVPPGPFVMGTDNGLADEGPAHRVYVSAFYIDRTEVTNASFARFVREAHRFDEIEGSWFRYCAQGALDLIAHYEKRYGVVLAEFDPHAGSLETSKQRLDDLARWRSAAAALNGMLAGQEEVRELIDRHSLLPVRGVAWRDVQAFARWAGKRLPTEAEWEKAARGADQRDYPWGADWSLDRCASEIRTGPHPVGSIPDGASSYGCLDMAGNVWEWVDDWYGESYYTGSEEAQDPRGPKGLPDGQLPSPDPDADLLRTVQQGRESDTRKVIRGGGWAGPEAQIRFNARCTRRLWSNPSYWHPDVGFRCAMDAD